MLKLRSCPKCRGDLCVDRGVYGWYERCIQCGYLGFAGQMDSPTKGMSDSS